MKNRIILLSLIFAVLMGCDNSSRATHNLKWSTNGDVLRERLKFKYEITKCEWTMTSIVYGENSFLWPPPAAEAFVCGVIYMTPEEIARLMSAHDWTAFPKSQIGEIPSDSRTEAKWFYDECQKHIFAAHGLSDSTNWLYSESYSKEFSRSSPFCVGRILLAPELGVVYFFLNSI